jgi:hypothetical protein
MAVTTTTVSPGNPRSHIEWGPIILGTLAASAISVVLLTFGAALGLSATSAQPYAGLSAKAVGILSAVYAALVLVGSLAAGGYLAGRLRTPWGEGELVEQEFRDGAHGLGVWALSVLLGAILAASGVGGIIKATSGAVATVAAAGAAGAASNPALANQLSMMPADYAMDRLLTPAPAAAPDANAAPSAATPARAAPSRADVTPSIARSLAAGIKAGQLDPRDRTTLVQIVMQQTGLPQAEAEKRVDEAFAELKAAEQKARDAAEVARKAALIAAFAAAAILAAALAAACAGAALGARHRNERTEIALFGSTRFW